MIPLGLCSVGGLFLAIQGWLDSRWNHLAPPGSLHTPQNNSNQAPGDSPASRLRLRLHQSQHLPEPERQAQLEADWEREIEKSTRSLQLLAAVASIAPMVGLLGTVSGMIQAFQNMATGGMGKPELLAGNIGEALVTTATGLVIAIPAMLTFTFLKNRTMNHFDQLLQQLEAQNPHSPGNGERVDPPAGG